jgi:hypothetical protein
MGLGRVGFRARIHQTFEYEIKGRKPVKNAISLIFRDTLNRVSY